MDLPGRVTFVAGTLGRGGAERQLYYMLSVLKENGVDVRLLCLSKGEFWEEPIRELGVPVTWVGQSGLRPMRLMRICSLLREERPDILQSQHFYTNLYVAGAARMLGLREVGAIRNNVMSEIQMGFFGRASLRSPRILAANSRAGVAAAEAMGVDRSRCFFLPNVVDTKRFQPVVRSDHQGAVRLLAVGRLVEQKRFDRFLNILAQLRGKTRTPFQAVIVGEGPKAGELKDQAARLNLVPDLLRFEGMLADMKPAYDSADALVLTSDFEGTPNVILEAMASGLPIVTTPVGGITEVVTDGLNGVLAQTCDEADLLEGVARVIDDPQFRQRVGRAARDRIEEGHSVERLAHFLEQLYKKALA